MTICGESSELSQPFIVFAAENLLEHEATYPLPESQVDRFLLKLKIEYPGSKKWKISTNGIASIDQILSSRQLIDEIFIDERVRSSI
jgi:MoxR-like ATPase